MIGGGIMLERRVAKEFLDEEFGEVEIPDDIFKEALGI